MPEGVPSRRPDRIGHVAPWYRPLGRMEDRRLQAVAVFVGAHARELLEHAGEVGRVGVAHHLADLADLPGGTPI